ncbi:hypothetical protein QBC47DRAFT_407906 [Echria macrotheca]|uniref:Uncharacterized protein n=1 Tax=Echria macrotheca TaxID=438768 RepID=A0AAJ0F5U8_9PEZI|nr:hypothetical protein QBC47DRAFT_407906 [Echria macrotheca]
MEASEVAELNPNPIQEIRNFGSGNGRGWKYYVAYDSNEPIWVRAKTMVELSLDELRGFHSRNPDQPIPDVVKKALKEPGQDPEAQQTAASEPLKPADIAPETNLDEGDTTLVDDSTAITDAAKAFTAEVLRELEQVKEKGAPVPPDLAEKIRAVQRINNTSEAQRAQGLQDNTAVHGSAPFQDRPARASVVTQCGFTDAEDASPWQPFGNLNLATISDPEQDESLPGTSATRARPSPSPSRESIPSSSSTQNTIPAQFGAVDLSSLWCTAPPNTTRTSTFPSRTRSPDDFSGFIALPSPLTTSGRRLSPVRRGRSGYRRAVSPTQAWIAGAGAQSFYRRAVSPTFPEALRVSKVPQEASNKGKDTPECPGAWPRGVTRESDGQADGPDSPFPW